MKRAALLSSFFLVASLAAACGDDVGEINHDEHAHDEGHAEDGHDDHGHDDHGHDDHGHDDHHGHDHDPNEVMTTVQLTFTAASSGEAFTATWENIDQDDTPNVDPINLTQGEVYAVSITVLNELEDPAEDVTIELRDELDEHQTFWTGDKVSSPANESADPIITQAYDDEDANGWPVGLENTVEAVSAGSTVLTFMLRHMPPVNGEAVKTGTLADVVKSDGPTALPGSTDISVEFDVTVQ